MVLGDEPGINDFINSINAMGTLPINMESVKILKNTNVENVRIDSHMVEDNINA